MAPEDDYEAQYGETRGLTGVVLALSSGALSSSATVVLACHFYAPTSAPPLSSRRRRSSNEGLTRWPRRRYPDP